VIGEGLSEHERQVIGRLRRRIEELDAQALVREGRISDLVAEALEHESEIRDLEAMRDVLAPAEPPVLARGQRARVAAGRRRGP
jgi:hypothetical protein